MDVLIIPRLRGMQFFGPHFGSPPPLPRGWLSANKAGVHFL